MGLTTRSFALVATLALVLFPSATPHAQTIAAVTFEAPASGPAGPGLGNPYDGVLPSGRYLHPIGKSVVTGMNALGFALSPNGRYAIVSNDDEDQAKTTSLLDRASTGGYSLAVVDTETMTVVSRYRAPGEAFFVGVAAVVDPARPGGTLVLASGGATNDVYAFDLDIEGNITPDAHHVIAMPTPTDARFADNGHAFPSTIVVAPHARVASVVDNLGDDVARIDLATRTVVGSPVAVGYFPLAAAAFGDGLLVANEGLARYGVLPVPAAVPAFASPVADLARASSVSVLRNAPGGSLVASAAVPLDRGPDGIHDVGGVHPSALVVMHRKPYAFVAMSTIDRIATIRLGARPHVVGGTELRLYDRGPYGTQPDAMALSRDERRLYVALAGIDAIAVLDTTDPEHPHRVGLIPTGWDPSAIVLSPDGRTLYVANAKGLGHDRGFTGDQQRYVDPKGHVQSVFADSTAVWSTLERIDLTHVDLRKTTPLALSYLRSVRPAAVDPLVPQNFAGIGSDAIKHVVLILEGGKTYDAMLGDLKDAAGAPYGPGDPRYVAFDEPLTPNLHALARTFAIAGNFYADADESGAGHEVAASGTVGVYTEKTSLVRDGRAPIGISSEDPENYSRAGYIFNSLAARGLSYRDYGDFLRLSGYDESGGSAAADAPTQGLGGLYTLDVPALASLGGHVDPNYPGWNLHVTDARRAREFVRDIDPFVKAGQMPAYTHIWLPNDRGGSQASLASLSAQVADGDRALGTIVDYLTHSPAWSSTAIFIMPDAARSTRDHIDVDRTYAIVVSPYAKRAYVGKRHLSTASVLKTEEEILGLPALSLGDALASDMSDFFTTTADPAPFEASQATSQIDGADASAKGRAGS